MDSLGTHGNSQNQNSFNITAGNGDTNFTAQKTAEDARFEFTQRLVFGLESKVDKVKDQLISLKMILTGLILIAIFVFSFLGYTNYTIIMSSKIEYDKLRYINSKLDPIVSSLEGVVIKLEQKAEK